MEIISISMKKEAVNRLNNLQKELNFNGRSEMIRHALELLVEEKKSLEKLKGHTEAVLILLHDHRSHMEKIRHKYADIVDTQLHNHVCKEKCLEVFVLHGDAEQIKKFYTEVRKNIDSVKLVVP